MKVITFFVALVLLSNVLIISIAPCRFSFAADLASEPYACPLAENVNKILAFQEDRFLADATNNPDNNNNNNNNNNIKKQTTPEIGRYENDLFWAMSLSSASGSVRGLPCLEVRGGWWTHEICLNRYIRQFHDEPAPGNHNDQRRIVVSEFVLGLSKQSIPGLASSSSSSSIDKEHDDDDRAKNKNDKTPDFIVANRQIRYADGSYSLQRKIPHLEAITSSGREKLHQNSNFRCTKGADRHMVAQRNGMRSIASPARAVTFTYSLGTVCDITNAHREVDLVMVCEREDVLVDWNISESGAPCHYTAFLFGKTACNILRQAGLDGGANAATTTATTTNPGTTKTASANHDKPTTNNNNNNNNNNIPDSPTRTTTQGSSSQQSNIPQQTHQQHRSREEILRSRRVKLVEIFGIEETNQLSDNQVMSMSDIDYVPARLQSSSENNNNDNKGKTSKTVFETTLHKETSPITDDEIRETLRNNNNNNNNKKSISASAADSGAKTGEQVTVAAQTTEQDQKDLTGTVESLPQEAETMVTGNNELQSSPQQQQQQQSASSPPAFPALTQQQEEFFLDTMMFET